MAVVLTIVSLLFLGAVQGQFSDYGFFDPRFQQQQPQQFQFQPQQPPRQNVNGQGFPSGPQQQPQPQQPQSFGNIQQQSNDFGKSIQKRFIDVFKFKQIPALNPSQGGQQTFIPNLANISGIIPKNGFFFDLNPNFRSAVNDLEQSLLAISDTNTFAQTMQQLQNSPDLNKQVWLRGSIKSILNHPSMSNFKIPTLFEVSPGTVFPSQVIQSVGQEVQRPQQQRRCVVLDGSIGADNGQENTFWYFREDVMVNSHHWFWHLYHPMQPVVKQDRSGEKFIGMHHSLLARYNSERLSNGFSRVVPFSLGRGAVAPEPYNSHLSDTDSAVPWAPRPANTRLPDVILAIANMSITMNDALMFQDRILQAIDQGSLISPQGNIQLNTFSGIDSLGDTMESTVFNVNPDYYGRLGQHNTGHVFIAFSVDPTGRSAPGVMADTSTAMRDVLFYRWHARIDQIAQSYKDRLPPYQLAGGDFPLLLPGIIVDGIRVVSKVPNQSPNQLRTFFKADTFVLSNGLDFFRDPNAGTVSICATHLDHEEFEYQFTIRKDPASTVTRATVRIFLAPRFNEQGQRFSIQEQRNLFYALDAFSVNLQNGPNSIVRQSVDSTLTISWPQSLQELNADQNRTRVYCGCGWPHHLLLPRGRSNGMVFDLFVMITEDRDGNIPSINVIEDKDGCEMSYLYCGIRNQKYPDPKPMGYPFDRLPYSVPASQNDDQFGFGQFGGSSGSRIVANLDEYAQGIPNAAIAQLAIYHEGNQS